MVDRMILDTMFNKELLYLILTLFCLQDETSAKSSRSIDPRLTIINVYSGLESVTDTERIPDTEIHKEKEKHKETKLEEKEHEEKKHEEKKEEKKVEEKEEEEKEEEKKEEDTDKSAKKEEEKKDKSLPFNNVGKFYELFASNRNNDRDNEMSLGEIRTASDYTTTSPSKNTLICEWRKANPFRDEYMKEVDSDSLIGCDEKPKIPERNGRNHRERLHYGGRSRKKIRTYNRRPVKPKTLEGFYKLKAYVEEDDDKEDPDPDIVVDDTPKQRIPGTDRYYTNLRNSRQLRKSPRSQQSRTKIRKRARNTRYQRRRRQGSRKRN